ncbi:5'-3' exonuclease [Metabacillus iocasae]|uniref:5'-3' exonuclease n=1 Tax=Priestia iocasae TaxID=2291674 RepID=A0ABS2QU21_9BACI|nr:5'-3' exonuclease H3TH domain-containing protein [Metabacillus iocasae]MBM7702004.1 5'-3' exonuclease [Metabacillus iocasae]
MKETLLLIDGFNLLSRCYFATSYGREEVDLPRNSQGLYINALKVTLQKILQLSRQYATTHIVVAWDVKRNETKRRDIYSDYKGTRGELPDPLIQQYETLREFFDCVGVSQVSVDFYEADDVIGVFSARWSEEKEQDCFIYSNDRDLLQLLNQHVSQIIAMKRIGEIVYTADDFQHEYDISPKQWIDVKALLGDKSDNIPGVPGVGEKAALPLIQQYESIENLYKNLVHLDSTFKRYKKKLEEGEELAYLSKQLVEIETNLDILNKMSWEELRFVYDRQRWIDEIERLELNIMLPA